MPRSALVGDVVVMLQDVGFVVSDRVVVRPKSLGLAIRRGEDLLLSKILGDIDAFGGVTNSGMRRLGSYLDATPLVVELQTRDEDLKPGVIYLRRGVPALNPNAVMDLLVEKVPPFIHTVPDGLYVDLDSGVLAEEQQERGWGLGQLATELSVSWRAALRHKDGMNTSIEAAIHLRELLDRPLSSPVDALTGAEDACDAEPTPDDLDVNPDDEHVLSVLMRASFTIYPTVRVPFKAVNEDAGRKEEMGALAGHSPFTRSAEKRAQIIPSLGEIARARSCLLYISPSPRDYREECG